MSNAGNSSRPTFAREPIPTGVGALRNRQRVIVVVTEGAAPALLDRWCERGLLPGFSALRKQGVMGPLDAEGVPYEPPGLVSLLTGRTVGDHGFFSYWTCHDPGYQPQVLTSADRRHPLLWQQPDFAGLKFACIGLFGTHPPEPLDGFVITYPMYATLHACYPRDLQRTLAKRGIRPVHDVSIFWTGQPRSELLPRLLEADAQRGKAALALFDDGVDVVIVNLTSMDRTSHIYWQELERDPPDDEGSAVFAAYRTADQVIDAALGRVDERTHLIAFSEIGFGPLRAYCSINDVLASTGFLHCEDGGAIDFDRSRAYEAVQGTHGININLRDRYRSGVVASADYERVRDDVASALAQSHNPLTGLPFFTEVSRREEVYAGSAVDLAPDLILQPADWRYLPMGDPRWASHVHRTWQSGWHRPRSYWAGAGPAFSPGGREGDGRAATVVDVAATICAVLERQPPDQAGTSLAAHS